LGALAPLTADLLRSAAVEYCTSQQQADAPDDWFEQAVAYATTSCTARRPPSGPPSAVMSTSCVPAPTPATEMLLVI
jgi:hypothetical protein